MPISLVFDPISASMWASPAGVGLLSLIALAGAAVGSFIGTALERLPHDRSILRGRSACDGCSKALTPAELVPVLSWLLLRGRCRGCGLPIGFAQIGSELAAGAIALVSVLILPLPLAAASAILGWQLLLLGLLDLRHLWLPRMLVVVLALTGAGWRLWEVAADGSLKPLLHGAVGAALGFGLLWGVARAYRALRGRQGMGGGDPPLLGAIGVGVGPVDGSVRPLVPVRYRSLSEAETENGRSRVYNGSHWQADSTTGIQQAQQTVRYARATLFRRR